MVLGESNENNIVVEMGLNEGDRLYLSVPSNPESMAYTGLDLMEEIERRKAEEQRKRDEAQERMKQQQQKPPGFQGRSGQVRKSRG